MSVRTLGSTPILKIVQGQPTRRGIRTEIEVLGSDYDEVHLVRRKTNRSKTLYLFVNKDDLVRVNGKVLP
jgi:hypothetical protein